VDTLGGDAHSVRGVTTLGGNGLLGMSGVWIVDCDLVCRMLGMGKLEISVDEGMRIGL
jgi:hypothetical protein